MMITDSKFKIGDFVYLVTDIDQLPRIVTGYYIRLDSITYGLSFGSGESFHYDFEISSNKDILKTIDT